MNRDKWKSLRFWILLASLFLLGVAFTFWPNNSLTHSVGHALLIASVLAVTVDLYLKERLFKEVSLSVFKFMIGFELPSAVQDRIRELVTNSSVLRRDCELHYDIEPMESEPGGCPRFKVKLEIVQQLENITSQPQKYQHRTCHSETSEAETARIEKIWFRSSWDRRMDYTLTRPELTAGPPDEAGDQWITGNEIVIPARNRERGMHCTVGAEYSCTSSEELAMYGFIFPTLNVRVQVHYPEESLDIQVSPQADRSFEGGRWEYDRLFVPYEAISIRWRKKTAASLNAGDKVLVFGDRTPVKAKATTA